MDVFEAGKRHLDEIAVLFDQYRQFYQQSPDPEGCRRFIADRLEKRDSIILVAASNDGRLQGFTQIYPSFCSVEMRPRFYLYDLFVAAGARRQGVARALMAAAQEQAGRRGAASLSLETAVSNHPAKSLYEALGWERDDEFHTYHLELGASGRNYEHG